MRFLIVNTDYTEFMADLYRSEPELASRPSDEQREQRFATLFGVADFYSEALRSLGHEAKDVIFNLEPAQRQWASEHGVSLREGHRWRLRPTRLGLPVPAYGPDTRWLFDVLEAQVREFRPDVLYCMCLEDIGTDFIRRVRPYIRLAVGQHAAPHSRLDVSGYDLILSSLPNFVDHYRTRGIASDVLKLGFAPQVLRTVAPRPKCHEIVFIGGVGGPHDKRTRDLERMCERLPMKVWGYGEERLRRNSPVRACHQGAVWGREMYQTLADAKVVFNQHIGISSFYANNMRLYETTGVGSMLLTDAKVNLSDDFEVPDEVVSYRDVEECIERASYYLSHADEREAIAARGQARTLRTHTYAIRMQEMIRLVEVQLANGRRK